MFKKSPIAFPGSFNSLVWRSFRKNTLAFGSLLFILCWSLASIVGYQITPDKTPHANQQNLELAAHSPGHVARFLRIRRNAEIEQVSFFQKMLSGQPQQFELVPIQQYRIEGQWLYYETYLGQPGYAGVEDRVWLPDIVYAISHLKDANELNDGIIRFRMLDGTIHQRPLLELISEIEDRHIVSKKFLLGTDRFGRDMLSQLVIGARVSLSVGFIAVAISLILGISLGCIGGYFRGRADDIIVWLINVIWSIPTLLLVIAITFALGKGFWQIFVAVGLTMWVDVARITRGQVLSIREKEFVLSAKVLGIPHFQIIYRHILPNILGPIVVISAANFSSAILIEAGLSFLGIGVQPPMPSWGTMIREHYGYIVLGKSFLAFLPGLMIMLMVLAFMLVGNGLRDAFDKTQKA